MHEAHAWWNQRHLSAKSCWLNEVERKVKDNEPALLTHLQDFVTSLKQGIMINFSTIKEESLSSSLPFSHTWSE
jgi:hypothetical protein